MYTWHLKILQRYFLSYVMFEWFIIIKFVNRKPNQKKNNTAMNKDGPRSKKEKGKKTSLSFMTLSVLSAFKVLYVIFSIWIENWARLIKSIKTVYIHIHTHTHTHTYKQ